MCAFFLNWGVSRLRYCDYAFTVQLIVAVYSPVSPLCECRRLPTLSTCPVTTLPPPCGTRPLPTLYACVLAPLPSLCGFRDLYQRYMHVLVLSYPIRQIFTNVTYMCCYSVTPSVRPLPTLHTCVVTQLSHPSDLYQRYMHVLWLHYHLCGLTLHAWIVTSCYSVTPLHLLRSQTFTNVICMCFTPLPASVRV